MDRLQVIYPYYENGSMLELQLRTWAAWPADLKQRVKIIIVDDGSPRVSARRVIEGFQSNTAYSLPSLELYRVGVNIPWNQNGAHNLGFHVADDGWCLTTDIDHVVNELLLSSVLSLKVVPQHYYSFARRRVSNVNAPYKRHPNSWLLTRRLFWDAGGYDEDFAGYYGSDITFRRALGLVGKLVELPADYYLILYDEHVVPDANTRDWGRTDPDYFSAAYPHLATKLQRAYKAEAPLRFPWQREL